MVSYVVTGSNRGIGLETVRALASQPGNLVIGTARDPSKANDLASIPGVKVVAYDLDKPEIIRAAAAEVAKITGGSLDVLVNNGVSFSIADRFNLESFESDADLVNNMTSLFKTNTLGTILTINAFLPLLKKGNKKTVVNLSTPIADNKFVLKSQYTKFVGYGMSKSSINYITAQYAALHADDGFTFVAFSPGMVDTFITAPNMPPEQAKMVASIAGEMVERFKVGTPGWNGVPQQPSESGKTCAAIFQSLTTADNGRFISHHGDEETWF